MTGYPQVEFLPDGRNVDLLSDIAFRDSTGRVWTASKGKRTDGASIPKILWPWLGGPYEGFHRDGALLHDDAAYLFAPSEEKDPWLAFRSKERKAADRMIWEATMVRIDQSNCRWLPRQHEYIKANAIYEGLRIGGWLAWAGHAKDNYYNKGEDT